MKTDNWDKALAVATDIAELKRQLDTKMAELSRLAGKPAGHSSMRTRPGLPGVDAGAPSIAQQVLEHLKSAPASRGELIAELGQDHAAAITSALKKHKERGLIANTIVPGKWAMKPEPAATATTKTPVERSKAKKAG
jgi:hypothetical protein